MKLTKSLFLAFAGLGLFACSNEEVAGPEVVGDEGFKSIVLKINGANPVSRADVGGRYDESTEMQKLDIYFTNSNSTVQYAYRLAASAEEGTDKNNWDAITGENGLRFVGLDNVSAVYVVANSAEEILAKGTKLNNTETGFIARLRNQGPKLNQNQIIFAGNDIDITPVKADNDDNVPTYNGAEGEPQDGDQVYTADVTIRPIISRIEWGKVEVQHSGTVLRELNGKYYLVEWSNWNPVLSGIYQSNVYLTDCVFAATGSKTAYLFETPSYTSTSIVNGAWVKPSEFGSIGTDVWGQINSVLAYTGYNAEGPKYDAVLPVDYNSQTQSVPFHFFVPFETTSNDPQLNGNLAENPGWHFQLYYPKDSQTGYTVHVYESDKDGTKGKEATDDDALVVKGDFLFPVREDGLAYANVYTLNGGGESAGFTYRPGKIYQADASIAPFNVTPGFKDVTDYNVIVKVNVVDFEQVAVTPSFDKGEGYNPAPGQ